MSLTNTPNNNQAQSPFTAPVDLATIPNTKCEKCGSEKFLLTVYLKEVSPLLMSSGKPGLQSIPHYSCAACLHTNVNLDPLTAMNARK